MAKPKNPRLGKKPKTANHYMVEVIERGPDKWIEHYSWFRTSKEKDRFIRDQRMWADPGWIIRAFKVDYKMVHREEI